MSGPWAHKPSWSILALLLGALWLSAAPAGAQAERIILTLEPVAKDSDPKMRTVKVVGENFTPGRKRYVNCQKWTFDGTDKTELVHVDRQEVTPDIKGRFEWIHKPLEGGNMVYLYYQFGIVSWRDPTKIELAQNIMWDESGKQTLGSARVQQQLKLMGALVRFLFGIAFIFFAYGALFMKGAAPVKQEEVESFLETTRKDSEKGHSQVTRLLSQLTSDIANIGVARGELSATKEQRENLLKQSATRHQLSHAGRVETENWHGQFTVLQAGVHKKGRAVFYSLQSRALELYQAKSLENLAEAEKQTKELERTFALHHDYPVLALPDFTSEIKLLEEPDSIAEVQRLIMAHGERSGELLDFVRSHWLGLFDQYLDNPGCDGQLALEQFFAAANFSLIAPAKGEWSMGLEHEEKAQGKPDTDTKPGQVLSLMRRGYKWHSTVLRKAEIVVATI